MTSRKPLLQVGYKSSYTSPSLHLIHSTLNICSKAEFSYGFILDQAEVVELLFACRKHDEPDGNFTRQETLKEGELREVREFVEYWIGG